jgi:glycosyltransferase involved in cell wall biosynthesis
MGAALSSGQLTQVRKLKKVMLDVSTYKLEWMPDPWKDLERAQRWLLQLNFTYSPDVIHLNSYAFDARLFNVPVVMVGHSCVLSWWQAVKNEPAPPEWQWYADLVKRGLHSADVVVAPSHAMMMYLVEYYGDFNRSQVIYNAGDETYFKPGRKEKIVFTMGRIWDEAKNIKLLMEIAGELDYPVYIAGGNKIGEAEQPSNVHFLGKLDKRDIARWLSTASVFVLPAFYEPFGLSVLEAAYSGCALILGKIDSLREIWKDSALYCNPGSKSELKEAIHQIMNDDVLRRDLSDAALSRSAEFRLTEMAGTYFSLYSSLISTSRYKPWKKEFQPQD